MEVINEAGVTATRLIAREFEVFEQLSLCTSDMDDTLFIRLLVNEYPMAIPKCGSRSGSDLCPLSDLQKLVNRTKPLSDICWL